MSPQLYPSLCELAHVLSVDGPVRQRLDSLAGELAKAADKELQVDPRAFFRLALPDG